MMGREMTRTNILGIITIHEGNHYQPASIKGRRWVLSPFHMGLSCHEKQMELNVLMGYSWGLRYFYGMYVYMYKQL